MYLDLRVVGLSAWSGKNKNRLKIRFSIQQTSRLYLARCTSHPCIYYQSIISIFLPKNQINVKLLRIMRFSLEFRLFFHRYFCFLSYSSGFCFYFFFCFIRSDKVEFGRTNSLFSIHCKRSKSKIYSNDFQIVE